MARSRKVQRVLEERIPGIQVRVLEQKGSGAFEVEEDAAGGAVFHSKLNGDGHLDCYPAKLDAVVAKIQSHIHSQ